MHLALDLDSLHITEQIFKYSKILHFPRPLEAERCHSTIPDKEKESFEKVSARSSNFSEDVASKKSNVSNRKRMYRRQGWFWRFRNRPLSGPFFMIAPLWPGRLQFPFIGRE